jgi:hypothetical protein
MNDDWMPEAREIAAQCWCSPETKDIPMYPTLAEAVARTISVWMEESARAHRNTRYYQNLLDECANNLGPYKQEAFECDDGTISQELLRAKLPLLVAALATDLMLAEAAMELQEEDKNTQGSLGPTTFIPKDNEK